MGKATLELSHVFHRFTTSTGELSVITNVSVCFQSSTISAIIGPSGCGKTTLLNVVAGVLTPSSGDAWLIDSGNKRSVDRSGYVFQTPSLVPWLRVRENALFGRRIAGRVSQVVERHCDELLLRYGLGGFERAFPVTLSGGMQQRISIIRAVLSGAEILLLDEPFSNSDYLVRLELQRGLSQLVDEEHLIGIMATHDVEDAARLGDRVIVLTERPARIKGEVTIPVPRNLRLADDSCALRQIGPYVEKIWEIVRAPDPPVVCDAGDVA